MGKQPTTIKEAACYSGADSAHERCVTLRLHHCDASPHLQKYKWSEPA